MALMTFELSRAISEAAGNPDASLGHINAYEFVGCSVTDAMDEAAMMFMDERADVAEYTTESNAILYEAAIVSPDRLEVLTENVFQSAIRKLKEIIRKAIEVAKGILNKIKTSFFKLTKKYSQFVSSIRSRIDAAKGKTGYNDIKCSMYKWDEKYVTSGLVENVKNAIDNTETDTEKQSQYLNNVVRDYIAVAANAATGMTDVKASDMSSITSEDDIRRDMYGQYGKVIVGGSGNVNDLNDMLDQIRVKARGGKDRVDVACASMTEQMMTTLGQAKTVQSNIERNYNGHIAFMGRFKSKLEAAQTSAEKAISDAGSDVSQETRERFSTICSQMTTAVTTTETMIHKVSSLNISLLKEMFRDYANALTVLAKGPKKSA